jgi:hypothetical protein
MYAALDKAIRYDTTRHAQPVEGIADVIVEKILLLYPIKDIDQRVDEANLSLSFIRSVNVIVHSVYLVT